MTPECERLGLVAYRVEMDADVEALRLIRNACKDGFSYDTNEISPQQQAAWWSLMRGFVQAWLYSQSGHLVGYGLLRRMDDGRWWSSVAVLPAEAGKGYGGAITADLIRRAPDIVWASARLDNPAAMRLHREADWEEWRRDDRLAHYRTWPHVQMEGATEEWAKEGWAVT